MHMSRLTHVTYLAENGRAVRRVSFPVELHQLHVLAVRHAG